MGRRIRYRPVATPDEDRRQDGIFFTEKTIITIAVIWILILVVIVGVGYFLMRHRKFQAEFGPLLAVCQGRWGDVNSTYTPSPGLHPAIAVERNSEEAWLDTWLIPREVRAQSLAETQVVLCMEEPELILLESCPYTSWTDRGGRVTHVLKRYYYVQDAKLMEAKTGRTITVHTFAGRAPRKCGETEIFSADETVTRLEGPLISSSAIDKWLRSHLAIK